MHINLSDDINRIINKKVESGAYSSATEVIRDCISNHLKQDFENEEKFNILREEIKQGSDQIGSGGSIIGSLCKIFERILSADEKKPILKISNLALDDINKAIENLLINVDVSSAQSYRSDLYERFKAIIDHSFIGFERPDLGSGIRQLRVGTMFIFYRISKEYIQIVRVLHERMNHESWLIF